MKRTVRITYDLKSFVADFVPRMYRKLPQDFLKAIFTTYIGRYYSRVASFPQEFGCVDSWYEVQRDWPLSPFFIATGSAIYRLETCHSESSLWQNIHSRLAALLWIDTGKDEEGAYAILEGMKSYWQKLSFQEMFLKTRKNFQQLAEWDPTGKTTKMSVPLLNSCKQLRRSA